LLHGFAPYFPEARYIGVEYDRQTEIILKKMGFNFRFGGIDDIADLDGHDRCINNLTRVRARGTAASICGTM
jgi:hypothetical protein